MISKDINGNEYEVAAADLAWRPSAYGIVIHDDNILLVKENGKFHLPGGGMDLGEDPKKTVIREILEETGIVVTDPKLIDINSSFFTWETIEQSQVFMHVHALLLYYSCEYTGGNLGEVTLDEYEKLAGLTAEWVEVSKLDTIVIGTTVNWLPIVKQITG